MEAAIHEETPLTYDEDMAEEDRELLTVYQHCWDDDKVDIDLVASLLHKIVVTQPEGKSENLYFYTQRVEERDTFSREITLTGKYCLPVNRGLLVKERIRSHLFPLGAKLFLLRVTCFKNNVTTGFERRQFSVCKICLLLQNSNKILQTWTLLKVHIMWIKCKREEPDSQSLIRAFFFFFFSIFMYNTTHIYWKTTLAEQWFLYISILS